MKFEGRQTDRRIDGWVDRQNYVQKQKENKTDRRLSTVKFDGGQIDRLGDPGHGCCGVVLILNLCGQQQYESRSTFNNVRKTQYLKKKHILYRSTWSVLQSLKLVPMRLR